MANDGWNKLIKMAEEGADHEEILQLYREETSLMDEVPEAKISALESIRRFNPAAAHYIECRQ